MSLVDLYTGTGEVVRCRNVLPSERVMSCVKVYGRFGRRRSVACRHCEQMKVVGCFMVCEAAVRRRVVWRDMGIDMSVVEDTIREDSVDSVQLIELCRAWSVQVRLD